MSGIEISWDPGGIAKFSRVFTRYADNVSDLSPLFTQIGDDLTGRIIPSHFASEGGEVGGWTPLSSKYRAYKDKKFPGRKMLVRSGALYEALVGRGATDGSVWRVKKMNAEFGASLKYGGFHQAGTTKMPKREPLNISAANRGKWVQIVQSFLVQARDFALGDKAFTQGGVKAIWSQRMSSGFGQYGVGGKREARGRAEAKAKGRKYGSGKSTVKYRGRTYRTAKKSVKKGRRLI